MDLHILQHLLMPNLMFGAPEEMYVRLQNDKVHALLSEKKLVFVEGGRSVFDTFFNSMTVGAWRKHSNLDDLYLILHGTGKFVVRFGLSRIGHASRWLDEQVVELGEGRGAVIKLAFWGNLEAGMLYFSLEALCEGNITGGYLATSSAPARDVKMGIVITHFNRKQFVLPAIKRIREELLNDPVYRGKIELVVVDNSQNITSEEVGEITVIPNKNLGGSGGFTRGLLHLKDVGSFTHCLFMDDDASCEIESIRRAHALLSYCRTDKLAVVGSMLREVEPYRLFEKGAQFDGTCRPLKSGLDMRYINDLLLAEEEDQKTDYGGWWFFAFALQDVEKYAFPFFVRGDDSMFSITNKFVFCTLNGISTWGDDFSLKSGPLTTYLDTRYHLLHMMVLLDANRISVAKRVARFMLGQLFSYNYASAAAVRIALQHLQIGPQFWLENMDTSQIRQKIASVAGNEKLQPIQRTEYDVQQRSGKDSKPRWLFRLLTLNGFLLPPIFLKNGTVVQEKNFRGRFREIFRYKKICYVYTPLGLGYIAVHDKRKFFAELIAFLWELIKFLCRYGSLRREYLESMPKMTNEKFWRDVYEL